MQLVPLNYSCTQSMFITCPLVGSCHSSCVTLPAALSCFHSSVTHLGFAVLQHSWPTPLQCVHPLPAVAGASCVQNMHQLQQAFNANQAQTL